METTNTEPTLDQLNALGAGILGLVEKTVEGYDQDGNLGAGETDEIYVDAKTGEKVRDEVNDKPVIYKYAFSPHTKIEQALMVLIEHNKKATGYKRIGFRLHPNGQVEIEKYHKDLKTGWEDWIAIDLEGLSLPDCAHQIMTTLYKLEGNS